MTGSAVCATTLFDRADSGFLIDWFEFEELRPRAARHAASRGGHDAFLMEELDRHGDILRDVLWGIPSRDLPVRPLASAIATRLVERLLTPDTPHSADEYYDLARVADLWPAGTKAQLIHRLSSEQDPAELEAILQGPFASVWLFVGHEERIRTLLAARCEGASGDLRSACDRLLLLYSPNPDPSGLRQPFLCGTSDDRDCGAIPEWAELVASAGETSIAWGETRVTRPASFHGEWARPQVEAFNGGAAQPVR
jgi:hypothetical protein